MTLDPELPPVVPAPTRQLWAVWIFVDAERRLRSGWAIGVYLLGFVAVWWAAGKLLYGPGLVAPPGTVPLDDVAAIPESWMRVGIAFLPTLLGCLVVRQRLGAAYLADGRWAPRVGWGLLAGVGIISGTALLAALLTSSGFSVIDLPAGDVARSLAIQLAVLVPASVAEELLFHGFVFQQLVRGIGRIASVALTSILFGLMHAGNPNADWVSIANIALVGLLLGVITLRTGSLWVVAGLHVGWNVFQGGVWGSPVSGMPSGLSVFESTGADASVWNGGAFGYEASASNTIILAVSLLLAFVLPVRGGAPVAPSSASPDDAPLLEPAEPPETTEPPPM